jgi:hypothetical protein
VIFLLPVILTLLVLGALRGGTNMVLLLPTLVFLGAGAVVVIIAERDMRARQSRSVSVLPTSHLSRKMLSALRPEQPRRPTGKTSLKARGPGRRSGPRRLPD